MQTLEQFNKSFLPTYEKVVIPDYPYGFRLKCTQYMWLEFSPKRGFRCVRQTTNPKNGDSLNAPKKSTYFDILLIYKDDVTGFFETFSPSLWDKDEKNNTAKWLSDPNNFALFTKEQIEYIYTLYAVKLKVDMIAICQYCGADLEKVKPFYYPQIKTAIQGIKSGENVFSQLIVNVEAVEALKVPDFNPFTLKVLK